MGDGWRPAVTREAAATPAIASPPCWITWWGWNAIRWALALGGVAF
jgi:hypothetical protein